MLIAINRHLVDKADREQIKKHNSDFTECDLTAQGLLTAIKKGYAFCAPFTNGKRRQANFAATGFLAVDVDRGLTIEAATSDPFFLNFASFLYTTPSHTDAAHRFRIVFELKQPIDDAETMRHALTGLVIRFGADQACTDACRIFFGSSKGTVVSNGEKLPPQEVLELVKRGRESLDRSDRNGGRGSHRATIRSVVQLPADQIVVTEDGRQVSLATATLGSRIFCPQHVDDHPSAFVLRSQAGNPGFFCSSCAATFFLDDGSSRMVDNYRFNYGWSHLLSITQDEHDRYADDDGNVNISEVRQLPIQLFDVRHLVFKEPTISALRPKSKPKQEAALKNAELLEKLFDSDTYGDSAYPCLTLIRSPKGTGKTEWVYRKVQQLKIANERVLFIGHRRSLISASAERLGLVSYRRLDAQTATQRSDWFEDEGEQENTATPASTNVDWPVTNPRDAYNLPTPHYAICADSLSFIVDTTRDRYDVVIIDEVEQVIAHLLSDTMKATRREVIQILCFYLRSAREVYVLDADLNQVTINVMSEMLPANDWGVRILVNTWQPNDRVLLLHKDKHHLIGELLESAQRGERCFVCSNSKRLVDRLDAQLRAVLGPSVKILSITAANASEPAIQTLIGDIKNQALNYSVILASPALGTGIDITFPNDEAKIDTVFGIFEGRINTHFDIDQQLSRVRNPKRVCVWVDPQEYHFEIDVSAIRAEIEAAERSHGTFLWIDNDGHRIYHRDPVYETVFAEVTALQRASKNRLRHNFTALRQHNGWKISDVANDKRLQALGKGFLEGVKERESEQRRSLLLNARPLDGLEYDGLRDRADRFVVSDDDLWSMRRREIEDFYHQPVTRELLDWDADGDLREQIRNIELLLRSNEALARGDQGARDALLGDRPSYLPRKKLLTELLRNAKLLAPNNEIQTSVVLMKADLHAFAQCCQREKVAIERLFGVQVRLDVMRNPVQQLGLILGLFGLSLDQECTGKLRGKKVYKYRVSEQALADRMAIVRLRRGDGMAVAAA